MTKKRVNYKYRIIDTGIGIEVYKYNKPRIMEIDEDNDTIESRKKVGMKRSCQFIEVQEEVKDEIGQVIQDRKLISKTSSLEEKLKYGIYDLNEFNERKLKNLHDSKVRALTTFRRLFECNVNHPSYGEQSKFITFHFQEHITDRSVAIEIFKAFIKRLNYHIAMRQGRGRKEARKQWLRWMGTMETTKEGRWHFHIVFFNLPYVSIPEMRTYWDIDERYKRGFDIQAVGNGKREIETARVSYYMTKYIMKETRMDGLESVLSGKVQEYKGSKNYFSSNGLIKPKEKLLTGNEEHKLYDLIANNLLTKELTFYHEFTGFVDYSQYTRVN